MSVATVTNIRYDHHHHVPPHCDLHCATTTVDITARIVEDVTISASTTMAATA